MVEKLKHQFAEKMLNEKLDFLPLEESRILYENGLELETKFYWVSSVEEVDDNGYNMTDNEILEELHDIFGEDTDMIRIGTVNEFDEFTHIFCPAPTYIDLIK